MVAGLPGAHTFGRLWDFIKVVLGHATTYVHAGHRMILFVDKRGEMLILRRLLLLRTIQVIGHTVRILALVQAS